MTSPQRYTARPRLGRATHATRASRKGTRVALLICPAASRPAIGTSTCARMTDRPLPGREALDVQIAPLRTPTVRLGGR